MLTQPLLLLRSMPASFADYFDCFSPLAIVDDVSMAYAMPCRFIVYAIDASIRLRRQMLFAAAMLA